MKMGIHHPNLKIWLFHRLRWRQAPGVKMMEDRWLSVDEIGAYLGIKRDTVYKWISEKSMPANKIGRLWKFKKDEIDEWVRKGGASETSGEHDGKE
jgi:excisionase family DNA binding protein